MALAKFLRGSKERLDQQPLHDGYIWVTTPDNCMFFDHYDENNNLVRSQLSSEYSEKLRYTIQDGDTIELNPEDLATKDYVLDNSIAILSQLDSKADQASLDTHIDDKSNPHEVSGSQLKGVVPTILGGTGNSTGYITTGQSAGSAIGSYATAEGYGVKATGSYSHAEGAYTEATADYSHAEGYMTIANGEGSHAEGNETTASSYGSHAEGSYTIASGENSHAEGYETKASGRSQHVHGEYNVAETVSNQGLRGAYVTVVGNGSYGDNSNAYALDWDGNAYYAGDVYVQGTNPDASGGKKLATEEYATNVVFGHNHNDIYYTKTELETLELITIADIDEICGNTIYAASEVSL